MPNENVTPEDLKATAQAHIDDAKETVRGKFASALDAVKSVDLTTNKKLIAVGVGSVVASVVISKVVARYRALHVDEVIVISAESSSEE